MDEDFWVAWDEYLNMRRRIGKPLTAYGEVLALRKLARFTDAGHDPVAILEQSIFNCWQGLFEVQHETRKRDIKISSSQRADEAARRELDSGNDLNLASIASDAPSTH